MPESRTHDESRRWQVIKLAEDDYAAPGVLIQGPRCEDETLVPEAEVERLREAAKRVLEADMLGVRDLDALNALEDAAGFTQQGQRRG